MKKIIGLMAAIVALFGVCAIAPAAVAVSNDEACKIMSSSDPNYDVICGYVGKDGDAAAQARVKSVLTTVYEIVGVIAVIVIIIGAFFYMTSQGDPAKIKRAKETITYALIGLVVVLLAFAITAFVLNGV